MLLRSTPLLYHVRKVITHKWVSGADAEFVDRGGT